MFEQYIITDVNTNFRSKPVIDSSNVICILPTGTVVQVFNIAAGTTFYFGKLADGTTGYVTAKEQYVSAYTPVFLQLVESVVAYGEKYLGVPYEFGSSRTTDKTFDCSDFQQWIYQYGGHIDSLHWDSRSQCKYDGREISLDELQSGDLIFFSHDGTDDGVYHVAQYVSPNRILHTYSTTCDIFDSNLNKIRTGGGGVTYSNFAAGSYWNKIAYKAKRIVGNFM